MVGGAYSLLVGVYRLLVVPMAFDGREYYLSAKRHPVF